ncbi:MAG: Uma2 family endonuclease [Cyanobacterium sp. T60_A2020_053]|nr:Uma2 family endonuclease [Cyanobacterium sp. T60_A2020_053]
MIATLTRTSITLEEFLANPPEHQEWINGEITETTAMTIRHSKIQAKLSRLLGNYVIDSQLGGDVYTELPCRTTKQGRRPDVAYLTAELVAISDDNSSLPQSPSLVAEIASPADSAEDLFAKASEYLASGCEEVWLVLPENQRVFIITKEQTLAFNIGDNITTQKVLQGFTISLQNLFS